MIVFLFVKCCPWAWEKSSPMKTYLECLLKSICRRCELLHRNLAKWHFYKEATVTNRVSTRQRRRTFPAWCFPSPTRRRQERLVNRLKLSSAAKRDRMFALQLFWRRFLLSTTRAAFVALFAAAPIQYARTGTLASSLEYAFRRK